MGAWAWAGWHGSGPSTPLGCWRLQLALCRDAFDPRGIYATRVRVCLGGGGVGCGRMRQEAAGASPPFPGPRRRCLDLGMCRALLATPRYAGPTQRRHAPGKDMQSSHSVNLSPLFHVMLGLPASSTQQSREIYRVGIFLDSVCPSTRTPHVRTWRAGERTESNRAPSG